jgi:hypothetical protein
MRVRARMYEIIEFRFASVLLLLLLLSIILFVYLGSLLYTCNINKILTRDSKSFAYKFMVHILATMYFNSNVQLIKHFNSCFAELCRIYF